MSGSNQELLAGRRSPEPFTVRASDALGHPVAGAVVTFALDGARGGILSQRRAITNEGGEAETYLLEPMSGVATLRAAIGETETSFAIDVLRAPGRLEFAEATMAEGLPGLPHPDSVVRVRVLDTEETPMEGIGVWFTGPTELSAFRDTTDAEGWAETVIRRSALQAGDGRVFAFLLDFPTLTVSTERPLVAPADRVVLVSVSSLRADAIPTYTPPTLSRLVAEGSSATRATTVLPSLTTPAHLSLLGGVSPEVHEIFTDQLEFTAAMTSMEPLFKTARNRGLGTAAFIGESGPLAAFEVILSCRLAFGLDSLALVSPTAQEIVSAAEPALEDPSIRMSFVHLPGPDLAGQTHGFESDEYRTAVLQVDSAIADIVSTLGPHDLLIVTSDHGGGGAFGPRQHGSDSPEDVEIPLIFWGARAVPSDIGVASILDVAPTALWALGIRPPNQYEGRILLEGFR